MSRRIILLAGLLTLMLSTAPVSAGGWVVITLEELPEEIQAGDPLELSFMVRQHGQTPTHDVLPIVLATNSETGARIQVEANKAKVTGRFTAAINFPSAGIWEWSISAEPFPQTMTMAPINVLTPQGTMVSDKLTPAGEPLQIFLRWGGVSLTDETLISQKVERGQALFLAKGCTTCHWHDGLEEKLWQASIGPNLSHYRPDPDFVRRWLEDPAAIRPETQMPDLHLSDEEITALIAFLDGAGSGNQSIGSFSPDTCRVTRPPDRPFRPPAPYSSEALYDGHFWYGTDELWTSLRFDGVWQDLPYHDTGYSQKVVWWREGYDWREEPMPALNVTGRRLDAAAPPLVASEATNGYNQELESFILVGVDIPTPGCWELTGHYDGNELSFIVWIAS